VSRRLLTVIRKGVLKNTLTFVALVLSGGSIYNLSYLRGSFERVMLDALHLNDTELGQISALLGLASLICYFPGGWLADRFSSRLLLSLSCVLTGLGGFYMMSLTGAEGSTYTEMMGLHVFWSITSILTYWAALIKATQDWGAEKQGVAFGLLDSGRGLVQVLLTTLSIWVFSQYSDQGEGLSGVMAVHTVACLLSGLACWVYIPESSGSERTGSTPDLKGEETSTLDDLLQLIRLPAVWLMGAIVFTAYGSYWSTFTFARYAEEVYGLETESAAYLSTVAMWVRSLMPLIAGVIADRLGRVRVVSVSFMLCVACFCAFAFTAGGASLSWLLFANVVILSFGIFALRGVYFALMKGTNIPARLSGLAVGVVSLIGFTPDIIVPLFKGALVEAYTNPSTGVVDMAYHQVFFATLAVTALLGAVATIALGRLSGEGEERALSGAS